jgi:hypothetical protein
VPSRCFHLDASDLPWFALDDDPQGTAADMAVFNVIRVTLGGINHQWMKLAAMWAGYFCGF